MFVLIEFQIGSAGCSLKCLGRLWFSLGGGGLLSWGGSGLPARVKVILRESIIIC